VVLIIVGLSLCVVCDRQEANLNALLPFIKLPPNLVTIDERRDWDLMEMVREVFSSHIGGALAGTHVVNRAVQVLTCSLWLTLYCHMS